MDTPHEDRDLERRLRDALDTGVPVDTRRRHLAAIDASLRPAPIALAWRRRAAALVAATSAIVAPLGAVAAAENALPGDLLYPVKQVSEAVRAPFDPSIRARHRIEEARELAAAGAEADDLLQAVDAARDAVASSRDGEGLTDEFDALTRDVDAASDAVTVEPEPSPETVEPAPSPTRTPRPERTREPSPEPTTDASISSQPSPTRAPSPTPSPSPTTDASPVPAATPGGDQAAQEPTHDTRRQRYRAAEAGAVVVEVGDRGIRLAGVEAANGWTWRADREHEPRWVIVRFAREGYRVVFEARWVDGQVKTSVTVFQTDPSPSPSPSPKDDPSPSPSPSPKDDPTPRPDPSPLPPEPSPSGEPGTTDGR